MLVPDFDKTAPFVWAAYAVSALLLIGVAAWTLVRARQARRRLDRLTREDQTETET